MIDRAATQTELLGEPVDVPSASFQGIEHTVAGAGSPVVAQGQRPTAVLKASLCGFSRKESPERLRATTSPRGVSMNLNVSVASPSSIAGPPARPHAETAPKFPSSATNRTGFAAEPAARDVSEELAAFRHVRRQTVALLKSLGEADWQRIGTTPTRGTLTIEAYTRYLVDHDLEHLSQLEATRAIVAT